MGLAYHTYHYVGIGENVLIDQMSLASFNRKCSKNNNNVHPINKHFEL